MNHCMSNTPNLLFDPPVGKNWRHLYGKKLIIGFSGGKDSLALLHYLSRHRESAAWKLYAVHINHNLRGQESSRDEAFCRDWCAEHGVRFAVKNVVVKDMEEAASRGIEFAARSARYTLLEQERALLDFDYILTAHTLDDQLESFFVDLSTGASIFTLGGVNALAGKIVRPMLGISTDMVNTYLWANSLTPVYDGSNSDTNYVRNNVRHSIMPVINKVGAGFEQTILRLQDESRELYTWMDQRTKAAVVEHQNGAVVISRKVYNDFAIPEKRFLLGKWLSLLCRGGKAHANSIIELAHSGKSMRVALPGKYKCEINPVHIRIFPAVMVGKFKVVKPSGDTAAHISGGRTVRLPVELAEKECTIRSRTDGDRFNGSKLKDLFSDRKIELFYRDSAVIIEHEDKIIWVQYLPSTHTIKVEIDYEV